MYIELELPDDIAQALQASDLSRAALEALALEGYRSQRLGGGQVRRLLGFTTPMQVHAFLKEHGIKAVIASKSNRKVTPHDEEAYKKRNVVERCFGRRKDSRRAKTAPGAADRVTIEQYPILTDFLDARCGQSIHLQCTESF